MYQSGTSKLKIRARETGEKIKLELENIKQKEKEKIIKRTDRIELSFNNLRRAVNFGKVLKGTIYQIQKKRQENSEARKD